MGLHPPKSPGRVEDTPYKGREYRKRSLPDLGSRLQGTQAPGGRMPTATQQMLSCRKALRPQLCHVLLMGSAPAAHFTDGRLRPAWPVR